MVHINPVLLPLIDPVIHQVQSQSHNRVVLFGGIIHVLRVEVDDIRAGAERDDIPSHVFRATASERIICVCLRELILEDKLAGRIVSLGGALVVWILDVVDRCLFVG